MAEDRRTPRGGSRAYRSREERRTQIVDATLAILAEEGMHAWTTATLAERVGCSEATVFKHFRDKEEILSEALRRQAQGLRRWVSEYRGSGGGVAKASGLILHILEKVAEAGGAPVVILLGQAARLQPGMREEVEKTLRLLRGRLEGYLAEDAGRATAASAAGSSIERGFGDEGAEKEEAGADPASAARRAVLAELLIAVGHSSALRWLAFGRRGSPVAIARPMLGLLAAYAAGGEGG